jgi:hypothetical protein
LQINAGAVGTNELANNAVTTEKIADRNVTLAKLNQTSCPAGQALQSIGGGSYACVDVNPTGTITGSGTVGYIPLWNGTYSLNNSVISQSGGNIVINSGNLNIQSGGLLIGGTTVIDSNRNLVGINQVNQNLNLNSNNIIGANWVNGTNAYFTGTIYGNIQGTITPTGDINMNNKNIYNASWVNATNLNASNTVYATTIRGSVIYQGNNQVIDTINTNAPINISGSGNSRIIGLSYDNNFTLVGNSLSLGNTGVTAGTYGSASQVAQFTVNAQGRIISASNVNIAIDASQITSGIISGARLDSNVAWLNRSQTWTAVQTFSEDVTIMKNLRVAGNITYVNAQTLNVNGSLIPPLDNWFDIGNSSNRWRNASFAGSVNTNNLVVSSYVNSNLIPGSDNSYDLGSSTNKWRNIFVYNINGGTPITGSGASGQVAFFTGTNTIGGSDNLYWDNTNARLGIGTKLPQQKLDVVGNVNVTNNLYVSGNVGIGTTSPGAKLELANIGSQPVIKWTASGGRTYGIEPYDNRFILSDLGVRRILEADPAGWTTLWGNVGIGSTNPQQKLEVAGNVNVTGNYIYLGGNGFWYQDGTNAVFQLPSGGGSWQFKDPLGNVKALIDDNGNSYFIGGNVGIGTTSPGEKLEVSGNIKLSGYINIAGSYIRKSGSSIVISDV